MHALVMVFRADMMLLRPGVTAADKNKGQAMVSRVIPVPRFDLVIFGGTGDLARRKILPALYRRFLAEQMPRDARIIGAARADLDAQSYRQMIREALEQFVDAKSRDEENLASFLQTLHYVPIDAKGTRGWDELAVLMRKDVPPVYYFSVGPTLFSALAGRLQEYDMVTPDTRVVVEKPFGRDLQSAQDLNRDLARCFTEHQIFRIDHYLGKETVQNLMAVRFANVLFEPLWNAQYVDHVQITVAESVGVEGRGEYFDRTGTLRDMVQNHLMQLLCLIAMEPPNRFDADAVRDEKLKVIRALSHVEPEDIVRGQYRGTADEASFLDEVNTAESRTESFVALTARIANWRWAGVPFFLRTGKRLRARMSEIVVIFKDPPHSIFEQQKDRKGNVLAIRLQPDEGMLMRVTIKEPGPGGMRLIEVPLDMSFAEALGPDNDNAYDAYERLIMDVIRGDQTLFMRGDEVEAAWSWADPIIKAWENSNEKPQLYDSGGSGPENSPMLLHRTGRRWRDIKA